MQEDTLVRMWFKEDYVYIEKTDGSIWRSLAELPPNLPLFIRVTTED